ncbi:MAG: HAMP domain-containing histidine kinase [Nannocystis sp.]|nr:HAMP domain-containing sensor histidine kinase [Nannocystis sp.]MBA3550295.1 HAMP domain-containing histidine kinase [Nannocystis sp.]
MQKPGTSTAPRPISGPRFVGVFAAVALSFIGVAGYAHYVQAAIDRAATQIAEGAMPSIHRLVKARSGLRRVQMLLYWPLLDDGRSAQLHVAMAEHDHVRAEVAAYRDLPMFPGEHRIWTEVSVEVERMDKTLDEIFDRYARHDEQGARLLIQGTLPDDADRAARAMETSMDFIADESARVAHEIQDTRERAIIIQGTLCALAAILTITAGFMLLRTVTQYTNLLEAHGSLLERRADELEQFAGRVAHDILSPLQTTTLALTMVDQALPPDDRARAAVARGQRGVQRVRSIVDGLLRFARGGARPEPGDRTEVGPALDDLLAEVRALAEQHHIELRAAPSPPCAVACSPGVFTSLLDNLLQNAIKYMDDDRPERRIEVRVLERGEKIRFEVADTGPGIHADLLPGIFEPYIRGSTAGQPGIGLGLATVRRIAQTHGGGAGVESSIGHGSTFWFELPKQ